MPPVPRKAEGELYLKASIADSSEKKFTFPRSWHNMCLLGKTDLSNTSNKLIQLTGNYSGETMSPLSPSENQKGVGKKEKQMQIATGKVSRGRCTGRFKSNSRFAANAYSLTPAGGATPSGSRVQGKIYCSGSLLSSQQVYFYPFMHKTTRA